MAPMAAMVKMGLMGVMARMVSTVATAKMVSTVATAATAATVTLFAMAISLHNPLMGHLATSTSTYLDGSFMDRWEPTCRGLVVFH
jgi:hypothetical protein